MTIDYYKINELYDEEMLDILNDDYYSELFQNNILYLFDKKIKNIEQIVEDYFPIFIMEHEDFKSDVDKLISELGENYIELLDNDMEIWGELL